MAKIHIQSNLTKFSGELKTLSEQLSKNTISADKFLNKFNKFNKDFSKNSTTVRSLASDILKVTTEIEQLEAAFVKSGKTLPNYAGDMLKLQGQLRGLTSEMQNQKTSTQKLAEGMSKWGSSLGGVGSAVAKLGAIIGTSLTLDAVAKSAANYGKALFDLSQNARATGSNFAALKKASEDINKTTTLTRQESAKLVLAWQQGITGTKRSADEITNLTKAMALNGQSYEEIQAQATELMKIQNSGVDVIGTLNSSFQDKSAMDSYIDRLVNTGQISLEAGQSIGLLADKMRDGKNAAGDEELVGFHKALIELQKAGAELALTIGEKLAPIMMQLAGVATEVTKWLSTAPDWTVYGAVAVAALGAILVAVAPVVAALGAVAAPVLLIGGAITAAAATWAYFTAGANAGTAAAKEVGKEMEETKKKMAASGNMITGFESEDNEIAAMKAKQRANVLAHAFSKELEEQIDAKQAELNKKMQAAFETNLKEGKRGPGTGILQEKVEDKAGEKKLQTAAAIRAELKEQLQQAENIARVTELQVGSEQKRLNFLLNYKNDIRGVEQAADSMVSLYEKQVEQLKKALAVVDEQMKLGGDTIGAEQKRVQILGQINEIEAKSIDVSIAKINSNKTMIDNKEKELGLLESEMNLQKSIYAGLGPQLDTLSKMNDKLEETKNLFAENAKKALQQYEASKKANDTAGVNKYWQEYLDNQNKATQAAQKQVDLTKNLREGYLDAMGAFTNVSGSMAKIITTQQQGLGEMLRTAGQSGSLRGGGIGGGLTNPYAKFKQGGQLETGSRDELDRLMNARGIGKGTPMIGAASALAGMSPGQQDVLTTGGGKSGLTTGGGSGMPSGPSTVSNESRGGKVEQGAASNAAATGDPMVMLNQNMSKYVAEGIKMAGGLFEIKKSATAGAAGEKGPAGAAGEEGKLADQAAEKAVEKDEAKGKEVAKTGQTPEEFAKEHADSTNKHAMKQKENIAREEAELAAIDKGNRENPVKFSSNVGVGNSGYSRGAGGGARGGKGAKGGKGARGGVASGEIDTTGWAEANRVNTLTKDRRDYLKWVQEAGKKPGQNAKDFSSRVSGQEQILYDKYKKMGGTKNGAVEQSLKNNSKLEASVVGLGDYQQRRYGVDAKGEKIGQGKGDDHTKKIADNTQKTAKESEKTNKSMDKAREEGKQAAEDQRSDAAAMAANMAGFGGGGALGMGMGNGPTDFGMGAALGMGSGDNFGAGMFGFAEGGTVPGIGTGDTHPALLTPGEIVMPKHLSKKFSPILNAMLHNKYALGGVVGPAPSSAMLGGGGGSPNISLNVRGDSVNKIMRSVTTQLSTQLNRMMAPNGTTGRQFELSQ